LRISACFFGLNYEIRDGFSICQQHLMRHPSRNVDDGTRLNVLPRSTVNQFTANFTWANNLLLDNAASCNHCGVSVENDEHVSEILVQFAASAFLAKGEHSVVVWVFLKSFAGGAIAFSGLFLQMLCAFE